MTTNDIRDTILKNATRKGWTLKDLRVQPDPFGSWNVVAVSSDFEGVPIALRRKELFRSLDSFSGEWVDLLTPSESEWAGELPQNLGVNDLPLWPEALAREALEEPCSRVALFPSQLDDDLAAPFVATFYSLRGGVGRSTALAYTARILASRGAKVICVDVDLEAPGLAALFGMEDQIAEGSGLVSILIDIDAGKEPDLSKHLLRISESDDLYCLPAGKPDANYARQLGLIDPEAWYREERNPLRIVLDKLATSLPFEPDVVLLDARTGITPLSGPLLFDLADLAVIVFFPHPQAQTGTKALAGALLSAQTRRRVDSGRLTPEPRFLVSPVPASRAPETVRRYEHRALQWIADWLAPIKTSPNSEAAFTEAEITHFIPYREVIATSDQVSSNHEAWRDYNPVAEWIERFIPQENSVNIDVSSTHRKRDILGQLRFSGGTTEQQDDFSDSFVETDVVRKALSTNIPLVLGRKGTGKTAVFRWIAESGRDNVIVSAPAPLRRDMPWLLGVDGFSAVEKLLVRHEYDWRQFWTVYIAILVYYSSQTAAKLIFQDAPFRELGVRPNDEIATVNVLERILSVEGSALLASAWLGRFDQTVVGEMLLLFDGLDTGFGNSEADRNRRRAAIQGLFSFLTDRGETLSRLKCKILLREDIWRDLRFENKSHLFGRTVSLQWGDQAQLFKVALKRAIRSKDFRTFVGEALPKLSLKYSDIGDWSGDEVFAVWNLLVGEQMKGGKTAFTRNWVWNRLADGNEDHSPRSLLQLMFAATSWEIGENIRSPYERSVLRPRAFIEVLPSVSEQALQALRDEEFPELAPLLERLSEIGRTPIDGSDLEEAELVDLAREVGLLGIYEGTEDHVERYKVPEIYRYALKMTRKGQA